MNLLNDLFDLFKLKVENVSTDLELKKAKTQIAIRNLFLRIIFSVIAGVFVIFILINLSDASQSYFAELFGKSYYGSLSTAFIFFILIILVVFYRNSIFINLFKWLYKIFD
ncbi:MAG: hypothetical protein ABIP95_16355 [Pelobium sp.]